MSQPPVPQRKQETFLKRLTAWDSLFCIALLALGLALRMINLYDPPLDFHSTRQLRSAIIARGMYYAKLPSADLQTREAALQIWYTMEQYEPPILEKIVAFTYRITGGERVWVARIYSSLFWLIGGVALYGLVRRMLSPAAGLSSVAFYMILPWSVIATRAFQPDPWMVMWVLLAAYAFYRWSEVGASSWKWAVISGLFSGMAILVKAYAIYPIVGMAVGILPRLLPERGHLLFRLTALLRKPQVWIFAALATSIPAMYYLGLGERSSDFASFWIFSFTDLLFDRKFYIQWLGLIRGLMDVMIFFAALLGIFLLPGRGRTQIIGLWVGYFLIGMTFPFQIYTHDYYSLVLIPAAAIGLAPYFDLVFLHLGRQTGIWKVSFWLVLIAVCGYYAWVARSQVIVSNYRSEPIPWQKMGQELPNNGTIIGLTHDYGNRLKYYGWKAVQRIWPSQADLQLTEAAGGERIVEFESFFQDQIAGMDYFLVTLFSDLDAQPQLKSMLYDHYPIIKQGDGYVLFDLRNPKP